MATRELVGEDGMKLAQLCAECGREPSVSENAADEWRTYYEGVGDGVTLCPECAREIGSPHAG
jgi:hypothetical protein